MEYVTENGDTVEARGLTLKVELSEKTKNEIVSQAVARMQEATETIEKLLQALIEADAENAKLRELAVEQRRLADAIHTYWADGMNQEQFDSLMKVTAKVNRLSEELGIEVD